MRAICNIILIFILTGNIVKAETYYFSAPEAGSTADNLALAIYQAQSGDVFVLTTSAGIYSFNQELAVAANITIKSATGIERPIMQLDNAETTRLIEVIDNGSLELVSINFNGTDANQLIEINASDNQTNNYTLIARNCVFSNTKNQVVKANPGTFANRIIFENCFFLNNSLIEFSTTDPGREASFLKLELQSCVFSNCGKGAFSLSQNGNITYGSVLINHCVFDSLSLADTSKLLSIKGTSDLSIINSVFSNSTNPNPYILDANANFDFCNFYHCNDLGNVTGAHCLYYNPLYDADFFVTNPSLFNKGNDGKNIGPLPWEYSDEPEDTVDTGDNPFGYENQGVWVVPTPDDEGKWQSYFLKYNEKGKLKYRADKEGNTIPDFSYVGYMRGEKALPEMDIVATISPIQGDATVYIQKVIDSVAQNVPLNSEGFRGAILVKAGEYLLQNTIAIKANGIVLCGEGQNENQTVLKSTSTSNGAVLIRVGASSGSLNKITASAKDITAPYIPVGANYVIIDKGHEFTVGDHICIYQQFNNDWVTDLKMNQIPDDGDVVQWVASDYAYNFEREIKRIGSGPTGDSLIFYNPVVMALDAKYNAARRVYKCTFNERINNSGVENMLLKSSYASETDEDHAWDAIYFDRAENCWAKNVTSKYFAYSCVNISSYARYISVTKCSCLSPKSVVTGGRRYSFNCNGQTSLFTYCYASEGRHDFVTGSRVCGPNVFSNCQAVKASNDIGPHHRWAVGTLFDVISSDGELNVRDRSSYGTGHGWAGANQVMWNCSGESGICQNPWVAAKNYCIGFTGKYIEDKTYGNRPRGEWDGANIPGLNPGSLYLAQKRDRGITLDFGLLNTTGQFINDSTFQLKFNQNYDLTSALKSINYSASGNAGIFGNPNSVLSIDSVTVELKFASFGILEYNKQIKITLSDIKNRNSESLNGFIDALIVVPDQRPAVTMESQEVSNDTGQFVIAKTDKPGDIYLLLINQVPTSVNDMNISIEQRLGTAYKDAEMNTEVSISTYGLAEGYFYAYAVDTDGRISARSTQSITINNVLSLSQDSDSKINVNMYYDKGKIFIGFFPSGLQTANITIYDLQGRLVLAKNIFNTYTSFDFRAKQALYLVKIEIEGQWFCKKLSINELN